MRQTKTFELASGRVVLICECIGAVIHAVLLDPEDTDDIPRLSSILS